MCSSNVFKRPTVLLAILSLVLVFCTHPVLSLKTTRYNSDGVSASHSVFLRKLQLAQNKGDHILDNELNAQDSERQTEDSLANQGVGDAQSVPDTERDEEQKAKKPEDDDLSDVEAQIQEIAKRVGITEEELKQANVFKSDANNAADHDAAKPGYHDSSEDERGKADEDPVKISDARDQTDRIESLHGDDIRKPAQAPPEMVAPGRPHLRKSEKKGTVEQPRASLGNSDEMTDSSMKSESSELVAQLDSYKKRLNSLLKSEQEARENERMVRLEADELQKKLASMKNEKRRVEQLAAERNADLGKLRESVPQIVKEAKDEEKAEIEEMKETIEEQKRAFDELFEEKQMLSKMLGDEQHKLDELQEKIQHPDLGLWVSQRAERAAILVEGPETDAIKYYASKYMAPKVTKVKHRLQMLENRVEQTVDHLLPEKYGSVVAMLLSIGLVGFPIFVTLSTVVSLTKGVSLRQYVLLGNIFLTSFAVGLCAAGLLLRQDPLQTLYEANSGMFILLQLCIGLGYPMFLGVLLLTVARCREKFDVLVFGCELLFYVVIGMNYRARVWRPTMLGENIDCGSMMYVVYTMDFFAMTALTVALSRPTQFGGFGGHDVEKGHGEDIGERSGRASVSSKGIGSLGSGLMQLVAGGKQDEKAE